MVVTSANFVRKYASTASSQEFCQCASIIFEHNVCCLTPALVLHTSILSGVRELASDCATPVFPREIGDTEINQAFKDLFSLGQNESD